MYLRNMAVIILYYVVLGISSLIKQETTNHNSRWRADPSATARRIFCLFLKAKVHEVTFLF